MAALHKPMYPFLTIPILKILNKYIFIVINVIIDCDSYMIPKLNNNILPIGCHYCSLAEIKERFVDEFPDSKSRNNRFDGYVNYSKNICNNVSCSRRQLVNGSFTTGKTDPRDVDFVFVINCRDMTPEERSFIHIEKIKLRKQKRHREHMKKFVDDGLMSINDLPCCDCFFLYKREKDDKKYGDYLKDKNFWLGWFGNTRKGKNGKKIRKGILNLTVNSDTFKEILK